MAERRGLIMGVKRSDFAIRDEKDAMLRAVNEIKARYKMIDDAEWTLSKVPQEVKAILSKYSNDLKKPMVKFFAGDVMEQIAAEAHDSFIKAIDNYISTRQVDVAREVSATLIDSLRGQIVRNIDGFMTDMDANLYQRAQALKDVAAKSIAEALPAQLGLVQLKIESITERTTGRTDIKQAWKDLTDKYGSRETVKYRDGKNYPLNTYLEGRANSTATDVHLATTQLDAASSGIYTGMISKHGASDSCRIWEGKIICFSSEGRDILSKSYPSAAAMKTLEEVRADSSHIFKFNCRHTVTPYPVQFFSKNDAQSMIEESAA